MCRINKIGACLAFHSTEVHRRQTKSASDVIRVRVSIIKAFQVKSEETSRDMVIVASIFIIFSTKLTDIQKSAVATMVILT